MDFNEMIDEDFNDPILRAMWRLARLFVVYQALRWLLNGFLPETVIQLLDVLVAEAIVVPVAWWTASLGRSPGGKNPSALVQWVTHVLCDP